MLDTDLIPLADAAAALGISEKRLVGFILRNSLADPLGGWLDGGMAVYGWSCKTLAERLTDMTELRRSDTSTVTPDEAGVANEQ